MQGLHDRVLLASSLPAVKQRSKLLHSGICHNSSCEKYYTHNALECKTCQHQYCVYCDAAENHEQNHDLTFLQK